VDRKLFDLQGKVAVVTGASAHGGIGHAIALGLAEAGADVAVPDIDLDGSRLAAEEVRDLGRRSLAARCDVSDAAQVDALFAEVDRTFGRIDILVNNAYAFPSRVRPAELALADWERTLAVCLTGYFLCSQQALRRMSAQGRGCILNIGSINGASAMGRGNFPYSVAKGGVNLLTKELAVEYAHRNIRVNAILPAQTLTPGFRAKVLGDARLSSTLGERVLGGIPMNRYLEPEEFIGPALFLCSDAASAVTGVLLPVDGGNLALNACGSHTWVDS
jgi:NAD(P)-dependent dehydrogenase (short-subunit alcohol dehydrogenase family)